MSQERPQDNNQAAFGKNSSSRKFQGKTTTQFPEQGGKITGVYCLATGTDIQGNKALKIALHAAEGNTCSVRATQEEYLN